MIVTIVVNPKKEKQFLKFLEKSNYFQENEIIKSHNCYSKIKIVGTDGISQNELDNELAKFYGKGLFTIYF